VPSVGETLAADRYWPRFLDLLTMLWERRRLNSGAANREAKQVTLALLDELRATAEAAGARVAYAYLPVYGEITKPELSKTLAERFFFEYCEDRKIPSIYLRPYFLSRLKQGLEMKVYGHWSGFEHRIVAEGLADQLLAQGLVPKAGPNRRSQGSGPRGLATGPPGPPAPSPPGSAAPRAGS